LLTKHPIDWILTGDPGSLGIALTALSAATLLCALLAAFWLARRPRRAIAPCCARCGYLLADPILGRCTECGADLAAAHAVRRHARGVRWRPALVALGCLAACLAAQWRIGAGWMLYGTKADLAMDRWQRARTDPALDRIAPEVFVTRAMEEARSPGGLIINPRFLYAKNFVSQARLTALRNAILDPGTRMEAFAAARAIQDRSNATGDLIMELMPEAEHALVRRMLVDAVLLDPTLLGATPGADGALELPPFAPSASVEAYRYDYSHGFNDSEDLNKQFYLDVPFTNAIIGATSEIARIQGMMTHADGRRASRTIRFEPPSSMFGVLRPSRIWFVPAPTPDPAKWSVRVEGEIRHRFVSETLRDEAGEPLERVMTQRFRVDIDRVEVRPSFP
jgi:hypothetical protein